MKKSMILSAVFVVATLASGAALADDMSGMKMSGGMTSSTSTSVAVAGKAALTDAVVKSVDPSSGMITLKHGALANLGMSAMTMAYKAKDAAMLKEVKEGDNVKVRIENVNDTLTIVKLAKQ